MEVFRIQVAVAVCSLWLTGLAPAIAKEMKPATSASAGVVLIRAIVEGQPATLLLDTGAERSCLDAKFVGRLRLAASSAVVLQEPYMMSRAHGLSISDLEIQSFHLRDIAMLSEDLAKMSLGIGTQIDGIMGSDVLRHFIVRIDFSVGSAHFEAKVKSPAGGVAVRLQSLQGLYFVSVSVKGVPMNLLLDTGTNASTLSSSAWARVTKHWQPELIVHGIKSTGSAADGSFVLIPAINIGGSSFRNIPFRVQPEANGGLFADSAFDGLLGTDVLRQNIVTLDLAKNTMYLTRDPNHHEDPNLFSTIGIQFVRDQEERFVVVAVWDPSPAKDAGLKIGDRILAVNQRDVQAINPDEVSRNIHGRPGMDVRLLVDSDGSKKTLAMQTRCLLCAGVNSRRVR